MAMVPNSSVLSKHAFDQLGIGNFLRQESWEEDKVSLACKHIISRAVYPASELKTTAYIKENSAISELTSFDREKISKDRLYLFLDKSAVKRHFSLVKV